MAKILKGLSHDSVNRFLLREKYEPKDLFSEIKPHIQLLGGTLSFDDTIIDKPYSNPNLTELIGYFWSGKHHRIVKGLNLLTLYYTDLSGKSFPVNYRLYDKRKGLTKNRKVSLDGIEYTQVKDLKIPDTGLVVHLKNFGRVKVFRRTFKNEAERYYITYLFDSNAVEQISQQEFNQWHSIHWGIECYHRAVKQLCGIERFMVRTSEAIKNHIFCSIRAFSQLELMRAEELIENWYEVQRNLSLQVDRGFILEPLIQMIAYRHIINLLSMRKF